MDDAGVEVRVAVPEDAATVARMLIAFNEEFDAPVPPAPELEARLRWLLGGASTWALLAVDDEPVGLAVVSMRTNAWYAGPVALLDELYVVPSRRDHGIGSALLGAVAARCMKLGAALLEVNVDEGDADALRFYRRHGLALEQPDTGERAFYLSRELGA